MSAFFVLQDGVSEPSSTGGTTMCEKELRKKIAELSEFQAKIALYHLCGLAPIIMGQVKDAVDIAQGYPRSEG